MSIPLIHIPVEVRVREAGGASVCPRIALYGDKA